MKAEHASASPWGPRRGLSAALVAGALAAGWLSGTSHARAEPPKVSLELNKLEASEKGCRVYLVVTNAAEAAYPTYQLDLVLFQPDGVIAKRLGMDIGPVKPSKRSLKLFDLDGLPCDRIGSVLVNDVLECKAEAGPLPQAECMAGLTLTALGSVKISK